MFVGDVARGGKRPGAGAPRGNLNALKHGRRSVRLHALVRLVAAGVVGRAVLMDRELVRSLLRFMPQRRRTGGR